MPERLCRLEPEPIDALALAVIFASAVMVLQTALSRFDPAWAAFWSLIGVLATGFAFVRRVRWDVATPRAWLAAAILGLLVVMLRWQPALHVEGGQDQGIYVAMSAHLSRTGGLDIVDGVRVQLAPAERIAYDKDNNAPFVVLPKRNEGWHQPGVYIRDLAESSYIFQFYALHPMWMSLFGGVFGEPNRAYSLVFLSALNVLVLSLLAYEVSGRRRGAAFIAAGLLALNPAHVFLSRFPVSENVSVFFTATAFYYLARHLRSRREGGADSLALALSVGAWAGAFFTHIAVFLYAGVVGAMVAASIVTAADARERDRLVVYALGVLAAFGASLAFAMRWSLPYSHDVYRTLFGESVGRFIVDRWWVIVALAMIIAIVGGRALWGKRERVLRALHAPGAARVLPLVLPLSFIALAVYGLLVGLRLGFSAEYAQEEWIGKRWGLANTGFRGFLHSAIVALTVYVSPILLVFCMAMAWLRRRVMDGFEMGLLGFLVYFLVLRTVPDPFTPYYFYSRYLGVEVIPALLALSAVWLGKLLDEAPGAGRKMALGVLCAALAWEAVALAPQYPGGELRRTEAGWRAVAERVGERDLLILAGGDYPAMHTALNYYFGRNIVKADPAYLRDAVRRYAPGWVDLYVLSTLDQLPGAIYLGAFTIWHDLYNRESALNILPMDSKSREMRFHLFRMERVDLSRLGAGDVISFASGGNLAPYLGAGWSGQEPFFRWTDAPSASLNLPFAAGSPLVLRLLLRAHNCVPVTVRVNGEPRAKWTFTDCAGEVERQLPIRREDIGDGTRAVVVTFDMPEAKAPREVNPASGDGRKLGIAVLRVGVERAP